jgi:two-component system chemotaxis response regulator CheB
MPAMFTKILAEHIETHTGLPSFEGEDGMKIEAGSVYVAPGGKHMLFEKKADGTHIKLDDGPAENFCKPAVDPMLRSLVSIYGSSFVTVILTGMGADGLKGARIFVKSGGRLIAQDEDTSVVWGMPGAVANEGLCMQVLPLDQIGDFVSKMI